MGKFEQLFSLQDKLGNLGFFLLWCCFLITSFIILLVDDSTGAPRDFLVGSQLVCCLNLAALGYAITNNISWSKASFLTISVDMFVTWTLFAYFGGADVFNKTPIGVWNVVQIVFSAAFTIPTIGAIILISRDYEGYEKYLNGSEDTTV
jgi:hypothetical protein